LKSCDNYRWAGELGGLGVGLTARVTFKARSHDM